MRDDQIRERLVDENPWWRGVARDGEYQSWQESDPVLRARARLDLGYRAGTLDDIARGVIDDKLVVLRGPRRIGKSVLLKDTIAALCSRTDVDPRQVIYLPCDGMRSLDLNRAHKLGRDLTRSVGDKRRVWLLDEVTGIPGWSEALKYLRDNTLLGQDTVVSTGSSWDEDADVERNLLAGRAGASSTDRSRLVLPMTFREFLTASLASVPLPVSLPLWQIQSPEAKRTAADLELYISDLDLRWQAYLTSGGYPRAVAEFDAQGMVSDAFIADLAAWLHQDVDPTSTADSLPQLLSQIQERSVAPLDVADLSSSLGFSKRNAAELRIDRLISSFAALRCPQFDGEGNRVGRTQSKLYLVDPLLSWIPSRMRSGLSRPDFTHLTEAALGVALARAVDSAQPGRWQSGDTIGYLRTGGGREIDFAPISVPSGHSPMFTVPIEATWVTSKWRQGARSIEGRFKRGIIATRTILDTENPAWAIPVPILVLLLE
ncbi:MAG: ATP-binding protein [Candidatus Dormibacteria bacterium]